MTLEHIEAATRQLQEAEITIDEFLELVQAYIAERERLARIDAIKSYKKVLKAEATLDNKGNRKDG